MLSGGKASFLMIGCEQNYGQVCQKTNQQGKK